MPPRLLRRTLATARRATPPVVVPLIVRARLERALADPAMWARAREEMRFLLERSRPDADLEQAARRYIERWVWRAELRWRQRMITHQRVAGLAHLVEARDRGRGVIVNFMHHGQYDGAFPSIARAGVQCHIIAHPNMFTAEAPDTLRQHARVGSLRSIVHTTEIGMQGMIEVVRGGAVLGLASDAPGSSPVTFVGRRVQGSSGAARIAFTTGAPVLLLTSHPDPTSPSGAQVRLSEPLEPADFGTPEDLLAEMLRRHEEAVLAWPEAADSPRSRWTHLDE